MQCVSALESFTISAILILAVDKIKRQAKYSAWYDSPNDETNVPIRNPFSKWKPSSSSNTRLDSEEAGPSLNFTRTDSPDNIEHIPSHAKSSIDVEKSHPKITFSDNYTNDAPSHKDDDANDGKIKPRFTAWSQIRATLLNSWINVLFLLVPAGFALNYTNVSAAAVFTVNFVALIPSTVMISFAVEEIMLRTGDIWQGLLSNTFRFDIQTLLTLVILKSPKQRDAIDLLNPPTEEQSNNDLEDFVVGHDYLEPTAHDRFVLLLRWPEQNRTSIQCHCGANNVHDAATSNRELSGSHGFAIHGRRSDES